MQDVLMEIVKAGFVKVLVEIAIAGVISGFGFSIVLSLLGWSAYKTFNLIERSSY